jgi:DNA-directed RNA polymerase specialized sigma24 family protein
MTAGCYVDFHEVRPEHGAIHAELQNWARWCFSRGAPATHPMFRWAKPAQHWHAVEIQEVTDPLSAMRIEKAVHKLPTKHQAAVRWSYVFQGPPRKTASTLGLTLDGLALMVHDARTMLKNRTA